MASVIEAEPQVPVPGSDNLYEIIDGRIVDLPPMNIYAVRVATRLSNRVNAYSLAANLGEGVSEGLFRLPLLGRNRRPDFAWVSYDQWAKDRPLPETDNAWGVAPDLAVEVISPTDLAEELMVKIDEYFRAGVRLVWVIYPILGMVQVYESLANQRILTRKDDLDGGAVLPGFRLPLSELFQPETPAP